MTTTFYGNFTLNNGPYTASNRTNGVNKKTSASVSFEPVKNLFFDTVSSSWNEKNINTTSQDKSWCTEQPWQGKGYAKALKLQQSLQTEDKMENWYWRAPYPKQ